MYYAGIWDVGISINIPFKQIVSNPLNKRIMKTKIFTMILTVMMTLTCTQYQNAVFSRDYSMMQIYYVFGVGMPGFAVQMNAFYKYIGEGRQPAYDWINGRF